MPLSSALAIALVCACAAWQWKNVVSFTPLYSTKYIKNSHVQMAFRQEFGAGGKILIAVSVACLLKSRLTTMDVRSTTICPSGPGSEVVIQTFQANDKDYHCLPLGDWAKEIIASPIVLPGSKDWDSTIFQGPRGLPFSVPLQK